MATKIPTPDSTSDWTEQVRLACQTLSQTKMSPAMVIQLKGEVQGATGQTMPLLLMTKSLAAEYGLHQEASLRGRTLTIRLSVASAPFRRNGIG